MKNDQLLITAIWEHFDPTENRLCYSFKIEGMDKAEDEVVTKYIENHHSASDHSTVAVKHTELVPLPIRTSYTREICVCCTMIAHEETDRAGKESAKKTAVALREHLGKILA